MDTIHTSFISDIRRFNRFYTNVLGLLDQNMLDSEFTLSQARVLYEIGETKNCTSKILIQKLSIDSGYLSRIIRGFEKHELVYREQSPEDKRIYYLYLTQKGRETMASLNELSDRHIANLVAELPEEEKVEFADSMKVIENALNGREEAAAKEKVTAKEEATNQEEVTAKEETRNQEVTASKETVVQEKSAVKDIINTTEKKAVTIRSDLRPGDVGQLIYLHGWLYEKECGYNHIFEGYVCKTFYDFYQNYSPEKDRVWIAEAEGKIVGAIAIVGHSETRAQLRWFILHPDYRGIGLGRKLLSGAIEYCRDKGFQEVFLETTREQQTAVAMYKKAGFKLVKEFDNHAWGKTLTEQMYEMTMN